MSEGMATVPAGGGYKFIQNLPNNKLHHFFAARQDWLVDQVRTFRNNNGIPVGNLEQEIQDFLDKRKPKPLQDERSLREMVTAWLVDKQFGVIKYVSQEEANARAKLASECPHNVINFVDNCLECYHSTLRGLFSIRQGKTTPYDSLLGACDIHGWHNATIVHFDVSCLQHQLKTSDPCWCATLLDNINVVEVN